MSSTLTQTLPIFCISGTILLPRMRLPLNIFEPRYIDMVTLALGNERLIGMVQPMNDMDTPTPPLYKIGCAGKIVTFSETDDGRFLLNLMGISRFIIKEEKNMSGDIRTATVDYSDYDNDQRPPAKTDFERARFISLLKTYFALHKIQADWTIIESSGDEELISSLCLSCPFEPSEKQALLEAPSFLARTQTLMALFEMACLRLDNGKCATH